MNNMTPNLIELIVQAVIKLNLDCFWSGDKTWIEDYRKELTTALASIPEMPQVDLGEVEKLVCITANEVDAEHDEIYKAVWRNAIGYKLSDLTSPPTKTE